MSLVLLLIFLLGTFLLVKKTRNENQKRNLPPGPWGLPLLGHLVSLGRNPHLTLMKWKEKYGPIISCRFGSFPTVVLCNSKMVKEAFSMTEFAGRPPIQVYMENNLTKGISFSEGDYNTELRHFSIKNKIKIIVNGFWRKLKEFGIGRKSLESKIGEGISEFMDFIKIREELPITSENIPSSHIVKTLWSILMSDELNPVDTENLNQLIEGISHLGPVISELANFMPWIENLTRILTLNSFSLISARSNHLQKYFSFFSKSLGVKKENRIKGSNPDEFPTPVDMIDFYLKKSQETTKQVSPFHASHQGQMLYADAVLNEVLRMSSVVALLVPRKTTSDVCFHGYTIKKGTMVVANAYGIHHDPQVWGDPENFRPERWFGDSGKKLKSEHFLPFSTGRRNCLGEALAREQLFLYLTTLFQKYSVAFYGEVPEVKGVFGIFSAPSKFTVVFSKRQINKPATRV